MKARHLQIGPLSAESRKVSTAPATRIARGTAARVDSALPFRDSAHDALRTREISLSGCARDKQTVTAFQEDCRNALRPGRRRVVLNLTRVSNADTRLVTALIAIARRARDVHVPVELEPSDPVQAWLDLCRVDALLRRLRRQ